MSVGALSILSFAVAAALIAVGAFKAIDPPPQPIRQVENCVCYKSAEAAKLQPWELAWKDVEQLRKQLSHCVCQAHIDIKSAADPARYLVPGTVVK